MVAEKALVDILPDNVAFKILQTTYAHTRFPYCEEGLSRQHRARFRVPIAMSQVSRRWRDLALSLPCLWNCIHVCQRDDWSDMSGFVKLYLSRSGQTPLSIEFECQRSLVTSDDTSDMDTDREDSFPWCCGHIWNLLFEGHLRWRHCVIKSFGAAHATSITHRMSRHVFPVLEHLHMPCSVPVVHTHTRPLEFTAPRLTLLRVAAYNYDNGVFRSISLPLFARLTTLELVHFMYEDPDPMDHFVGMLHSASATLEVLILQHGYIILDTPSSTLARLPPAFPRLACLVLQCIFEHAPPERSFAAALCLRAPVLARLHVVGPEPSSVHTYLHDGVLAFPRVHALRYAIPAGLRASWPRFVAAFPRLQTLHVSSGDPAPLLAAVATLGAPAWPDLRELVLLGAHEYAAVRFVQQRARAGRTLERVGYAGWFGARAQEVFRALGVVYTPARETVADGDDLTMDWVKHRLEVIGQLLRPPTRAISSPSGSVPVEILHL